jgi:2-desacetyl-2-hydroxyethyl bacteriochlorophyllide A dehydrogenase
MKAIICEQPGHFRYDERLIPTPAPGEALLRIRRIGICGTDIHAFGGRQPFFSYPRILGHELAAEIVALGDGDGDLQIGDAVTVIPYLECGSCYACRSGKPNCCTSLQVVGVHRDGGMQEFIVMPIDHLLKAPGANYDELALVECMAIGAHAVRRAGVASGEEVLVVGAGPIGFGIMQFARIAGARVIVLDLDDRRLDFVRHYSGADVTIKGGTEDTLFKISNVTGGNGAGVVFDATGSPQSMMQAFDYVAHGGRYVLVSVVDAQISFYDPNFHKREMTLISSRNATRDDFLWVLQCLADQRLYVAPLITHRCDFDRLIEEFTTWTSPGSGLVKGLVKI